MRKVTFSLIVMLLLALMPVLLSPEIQVFAQSYIFESDMDESDFSDWDYVNDMTQISDPVYHGDYAAEPDVYSAMIGKDYDEESLIYCQFFIRWDNLDEGGLSVNRYVCYIEGEMSGDSVWTMLYNNGGKTVFWLYSQWLSSGDVGTTGLVSDTWYKVQVRAEVSGSAQFKLWLNDQLECSFSGDNSGATQFNTTYFTIGDGMNAEDFDNAFLDWVIIDDEEIDTGAVPSLEIEGLENIDEGTDWVFTEWKYYWFTLHVDNVLEDDYGNLTKAGINFTVPTGWGGDVLCLFESDSENWTLTTDLNDANLTRWGEPVLLQAGSWINNTGTDETEISFGIWFTDQILDVYVDPIDVNAVTTYNETDVHSYLAYADAFYIYSQGGFERNFEATGNAGRVQGGEWCSLYANNGSEAQSEIWFRNLQHIKLLPEIYFILAEAYSIRFYLEYSIGEGEWLPGIYMNLHVHSVSYTGWLAGNVWINYTCAWYKGTGEPDSYSYVDQEYLYMFYHGTIDGAGDLGHHKFWVDLWFNSINASSTIGGRVNAYEYPMKDDANPWLRALSSNWGVNDEVMKESFRLFNLIDSDGNVMSAEKIRMVRVKAWLQAEDADLGQLAILHPYDVLDYTLSHEYPLDGIQTPVFDETKIPTMANTGFLGFLWSAFSGLGMWLSENVIFGGLNLWGNFVAFLDTIAAWFGAPGFFSFLFAQIGAGVSYLVSSVTYLLQLLYNFFLLLGALLGSFVSLLGELVLSMITTVTYFQDMMAGGIGTAGNLWDQLGISSWITLAIILYPIYLIILWDEQGEDAVVRQLTLIFGIATWLMQFFIQVIHVVINLISGLIESIPVAE